MILNIVLWILQAALAGLFGYAGYLKLTKSPDDLAKMWAWANEVPAGLTRLIGVAEIAGAVGIVLPQLTGILPWLTPLAALGFLAIQIIAIAFHGVRGEMRQTVWLNLILLAASAFVIWGRWGLFTG